MAYIVKRPINLNGKRRLIGEIIQDDEIANGAIIRTGWVKKINSSLAMNAPEVGQEETPTDQPRRRSRKKTKTEDGGEA